MKVCATARARGGVHLQCEYVRCGNRRCRSCPHGPYWYAYWREDGKLKSRYVGKTDPRQGVHKTPSGKGPDPVGKTVPPGGGAEVHKTPPHPWDRVFSRQTITPALCYEILGVRSFCPFSEVASAYKQLILEAHPDHGGDGVKARWYTAAYTYLKSIERRMHHG